MATAHGQFASRDLQWRRASFVALLIRGWPKCFLNPWFSIPFDSVFARSPECIWESPTGHSARSCIQVAIATPIILRQNPLLSSRIVREVEASSFGINVSRELTCLS